MFLKTKVENVKKISRLLAYNMVERNTKPSIKTQGRLISQSRNIDKSEDSDQFENHRTQTTKIDNTKFVFKLKSCFVSGRRPFFTPYIDRIDDHIKWGLHLKNGYNADLWVCYLPHDIDRLDKKVIKIFDKKHVYSTEQKVKIMYEVNIIAFIDHPNVAQFVGLYEAPHWIYFLMDHPKDAVNLSGF